MITHTVGSSYESLQASSTMSNEPELEAVKRELQELKKELAQQKSNFNNKKPPDLSNQIAIGLIKAFMILLGVSIGVWVIIILVAQLMWLDSLSRLSRSSPSGQLDQHSSTQSPIQVKRADDAIASEVSSKLGANLPNSKLAIEVINGAVTVSGTVSNQSQLERIAPLVRQIAGIRSIIVKVTVATPASSKG